MDELIQNHRGEKFQMSIENEIRKFIEENFILEGDDNLGDEDSLLEKGIIDSTGVLELVAFLEESYHFKIKDEELIPENLDSIKNISQFIQNKLNFSREGVNRTA
jgi:acyl carrier protein